MRGIDETGDGELLGVGDGDSASAVATGVQVDVVDHRGVGNGERVFCHCASYLFAAVVFIDQQRGHGVEEVEGVEDGHADGVLLAIAQDSGERRQVHTIGHEIEGLDAGDRDPEKGINTAGEDPRVDGRNPGQLAVDADIHLAEGSVATGVDTDAWHVVRQAEEPLFFVVLALRNDIKVSSLDIGWQSEGLRQLRRGCVELGAVAGGHPENEIGCLWCGIGEVALKELEFEGAEDGGGQAVRADDVAEYGKAGLRSLEQRAVIGEVALHVPCVGLALQRFGCGSEEDIHATEKDLSRAVELHAGLDGEVAGEDDLRPGSRAVGGRREAEVLVAEVGERLVVQKRDFAMFRVWPGNQRIRGGFKGGTGCRDRGKDRRTLLSRERKGGGGCEHGKEHSSRAETGERRSMHHLVLE